jgi:hypothetical protein
VADPHTLLLSFPSKGNLSNIAFASQKARSKNPDGLIPDNLFPVKVKDKTTEGGHSTITSLRQ